MPSATVWWPCGMVFSLSASILVDFRAQQPPTVTFPITHRDCFAQCSYLLSTWVIYYSWQYPQCCIFILGCDGDGGGVVLFTSFSVYILWKLLPSNMPFLWPKGKIVKRQELINDSTNKDHLNQVIKQQLTGFVIELNPEVSDQGAQEDTGTPVCTLNDVLLLSFQNKDLIYELNILNHMLLFISKNSESYSTIIRHYRQIAKEFQNKVCSPAHFESSLMAHKSSSRLWGYLSFLFIIN